ncbi:MAG: hypothetical protein MPN21_23040 [Thermoanaerobaculia bacterium]|nr:hypothetical protein [Thermoanaerobaculia bacterium]
MSTKDKVEETVQKAREAAGKAREQVDERAEQLRRGYERVEENVRHAADDFTAFVEDSPARAVLLAVAAGFVLGLISRGMGSRD